MTPTTPVLVGIPAVSWVYTDHIIAMQRLWLPRGSEVVYTRGGCTIAAKRLALAKRVAREDRFGALLCLDSDMTPPPDTVARLLSHDLPIVGALMYQRGPPYRPCAGWCDPDFNRPTWLTEVGGPEPLQRVDWCGTGCLLIRREALLEVPEPWFAAHPVAGPDSGSDTWFCLQAAKAGIPIHVDTSFCVGHLGITSINTEYVMAYQETAVAREGVAGVMRANERLSQEVLGG